MTYVILAGKILLAVIVLIVVVRLWKAAKIALYNRRKARKAQFEAAVSDEASRRVVAMMGEMTGNAIESIRDAIEIGVRALPTKFSDKIDSLTGQVSQLRKERDGTSDPNRWIFVAITLVGYKCNQEDTNWYSVVVELNPAKGLLRAAQDPALRRIREYHSASRHPDWRTSDDKFIKAGSTNLGAPRWNTVNEQARQVSLLGEIYHLPG